MLELRIMLLNMKWMYRMTPISRAARPMAWIVVAMFGFLAFTILRKILFLRKKRTHIPVKNSRETMMTIPSELKRRPSA